MIQFQTGKYKMNVQIGEQPLLFDFWLKHAKFFDVAGLEDEGDAVYIGIGTNNSWPELVIGFRTDRLESGVFNPGILIVPETDMLFIGAGTRMKIYNLKSGLKVLDKNFSVGFWDWYRYDDYVFMAEELEFIVYSLTGEELWSAYVEPPWSYTIESGVVKLDVMGDLSHLDISTGKPIS